MKKVLQGVRASESFKLQSNPRGSSQFIKKEHISLNFQPWGGFVIISAVCQINFVSNEFVLNKVLLGFDVHGITGIRYLSSILFKHQGTHFVLVQNIFIDVVPWCWRKYCICWRIQAGAIGNGTCHIQWKDWILGNEQQRESRNRTAAFQNGMSVQKRSCYHCKQQQLNWHVLFLWLQ